MKISRIEFEKRLQNNSLALSLVGMSGIGKTYRSKELGALGFSAIHVDNRIAEKLKDFLPIENVSGLASWMGQPFSDGFAEREAQYLALEEEMTETGLQSLRGNTVIDTTGSVIYLSEPTIAKLRALTLVVYIETSDEMKQDMYSVFIHDPKPIVWKDSFTRNLGESEKEALARSYPRLLSFRAGKYNRIADVTLPYEERSSGPENFLNSIASHLFL